MRVSGKQRRQEAAERLFKLVRSADGADRIRDVIHEIVEALEDEYGEGRGDEARNEP